MTRDPPDGFECLIAEMRAQPQLFDRSAPGVDELLQDLKQIEGPTNIDVIRRIMKVKLQGRAPRALNLIDGVPKEVTERVVREALALKQKDATEQVEAVRISLLCALPGVGVPVASAMLAWTNPTSFGVLDRRAWNTLRRFGLTKSRSKKNTTYAATHWVNYLLLLRALSKEMKETPQKIDTWLYAYDKAEPS